MVENNGIRKAISAKDVVRVLKVLRKSDIKTLQKIYDAIQNDCDENEFIGWMLAEAQIPKKINMEELDELEIVWEED